MFPIILSSYHVLTSLSAALTDRATLMVYPASASLPVHAKEQRQQGFVQETLVSSAAHMENAALMARRGHADSRALASEL